MQHTIVEDAAHLIETGGRQRQILHRPFEVSLMFDAACGKLCKCWFTV